MISGELQRSFLPGWLLGGRDLFCFAGIQRGESFLPGWYSMLEIFLFNWGRRAEISWREGRSV